MTRYELLEHTADLRVRVRGRSFRTLLQNAVYALTDTLVNARSVREVRDRKIRLRQPSRELLLARLLQEVLFLFDAKRFVTRKVEILKLAESVLEARAWGEAFSSKRHTPKTEIKGVTLHGLKVGRRRGLWYGEVVFDV